MNEENNLAYPQKLDINSFPKEKKRKKKKKGWRPIRRLKRHYREWQDEKRWEKANKKKRKLSFIERLAIFLLGPIADFINDIRHEREIKKSLKLDKKPNIFIRLFAMYQENKEAAKQNKQLDKKVRKSLSFVLEEDKRVFSLKDEYLHAKDTWKSLPWNKSRELENMLITTLVIILAFSFNYLLLQMAKSVTASFFDIPSLWQNGRIIFNIPDPSPMWTYSSVVSVYIAGPILLFLSGVIFLWRHRKTKDKSSFGSLLFLWLYLTAFVLFFSSFLAGSITDRGFGYVMGWLYIPRYIEIPFDIFSIFVLWMIGFSAGKKFISFAPHYQFYSNTLPQFFIKLLYIYLPSLISIMVLLLIGFNSRDFTIQIIYLSLLVMLTPTLRFIPEKMESYERH